MSAPRRRLDWAATVVLLCLVTGVHAGQEDGDRDSHLMVDKLGDEEWCEDFSRSIEAVCKSLGSQHESCEMLRKDYHSRCGGTSHSIPHLPTRTKLLPLRA